MSASASATGPGFGPGGPEDHLVRFDLTERLVHWSTAALVLVLVASGTILYVPSLMLAVGHRATLVVVHVVAGIGLLAPLGAGLAGPWRSQLVADLRRFDRWTGADFASLRRRGERAPAGKFSGGQKLATALFGGSLAVMVATGVVMYWSPPFPNAWASGATLVHDAVYLMLSALVVGHVALGFSHPEQLGAMVTGRVARRVAQARWPSWVAGSEAAAGPPAVLSRSRARGRPRRSAPRGAAGAGGRRPASG